MLAIEFGERAEEAVLRRGARRVAQLLGTCEASADLEEAGVCGAVTTRALDQLTRYRASHEKGFFGHWARCVSCGSRSRG